MNQLSSLSVAHPNPPADQFGQVQIVLFVKNHIKDNIVRGVQLLKLTPPVVYAIRRLLPVTVNGCSEGKLDHQQGLNCKSARLVARLAELRDS